MSATSNQHLFSHDFFCNLVRQSQAYTYNSGRYQSAEYVKVQEIIYPALALGAGCGEHFPHHLMTANGLFILCQLRYLENPESLSNRSYFVVSGIEHQKHPETTRLELWRRKSLHPAVTLQQLNAIVKPSQRTCNRRNQI